ncbi:MAG: protoglobin domain-containing protein [Acidobacteriota bacterium]
MSRKGRSAGPLRRRKRELEERQRFVCLGAGELELLASLREAIRARADEVIDRFYEHLLGFPHLREILSSPEIVKRVKAAQKEYLLSLTRGRIDRDYEEDRLRIGRSHEQAGLQPQWYLGAYSIYLDLLHPVVMDCYRDEPMKGMRACLALTKLMNLDSQIVLDAYFDIHQQRLMERSEHLAAVGEMAASIAHEVRNPLAGMKGAMEVLRDQLGDTFAHREIVEEILGQIERLENLVRDMLTYARPRPPSFQTVDLHHLLDRVLRFAQKGDGKICVKCRYESGEARVQADPQQMEQVFFNLVQNAMQAMEGGGELTVRTAVDDGTVRIDFQDTGHGIPPGQMREVFQPFFTTRHRGSGLGLAIVSKIVGKHGGSLELKNRQEEGTIATVILPRRRGTHGT